MIVANCREDSAYNEDFLTNMDKEFIQGFDYCLEQIVNLFENNLDEYEFERKGVIDVMQVLEENKGEIVEIIRDWAESDRNMMITSMIDHMDNKEYEINRNKALGANPDKYKDTRSWGYDSTGVKE